MEQLVANMTQDNNGGTIAFTMEMDAPESLETLRQQLLQHYWSSNRFTSRLVKEGEVFSLRQITDAAALQDMARVHEDSLNFEEM